MKFSELLKNTFLLTYRIRTLCVKFISSFLIQRFQLSVSQFFLLYSHIKRQYHVLRSCYRIKQHAPVLSVQTWDGPQSAKRNARKLFTKAVCKQMFILKLINKLNNTLNAINFLVNKYLKSLLGLFIVKFSVQFILESIQLFLNIELKLQA